MGYGVHSNIGLSADSLGIKPAQVGSAKRPSCMTTVAAVASDTVLGMHCSSPVTAHSPLRRLGASPTHLCSGAFIAHRVASMQGLQRPLWSATASAHTI